VTIGQTGPRRYAMRRRDRGFDVAETLRDVYHVPFMFLSAFSDDATRAKVQSLGALDFLIKPLEVKTDATLCERSWACPTSQCKGADTKPGTSCGRSPVLRPHVDFAGGG
jgi:two-component system, response regulator PdtaR